MSEFLETDLYAIKKLIDDGLYAEARDAVRRLRNQNAGDIRLLLLEARIEEGDGRISDAIAVVSRACAVSPMQVAPVLELGRLYALAKQPAEALRCIHNALSLNSFGISALKRAIKIAELCNDRSAMLMLLARGIALYSEDINIRLTYAQELAFAGRFSEALPHFERVNKEQPRAPNVLIGLMSCEIARGNLARARDYIGQALPLAPESEIIQYWYRHLRDGGTGQPADIIEAKYNEYAATYDSHLLESLGYQTPRIIVETIRRYVSGTYWDVLDLGCGTGLVGANLGAVEGRFVGVDLSQKMIELAERRGVYTQLFHSDLIDFLKKSPAENYDIVICCEVLVHVGPLESVMAEVHRCLRPRGYFVFSCETAAPHEGEVVLRPSQRFAHAPEYIQRVCRESGYVLDLESFPSLRKESGAPVPGLIGVVLKP